MDLKKHVEHKETEYHFEMCFQCEHCPYDTFDKIQSGAEDHAGQRFEFNGEGVVVLVSTEFNNQEPRLNKHSVFVLLPEERDGYSYG